MAEQKLEVINKAADLMEYSIRITSNKKRYPAKFRQLIARIQDYSMDIYELLIDANRLKLEDSKSKRQSTKNHFSKGNCIKFTYEMDKMIKKILEETK